MLTGLEELKKHQTNLLHAAVLILQICNSDSGALAAMETLSSSLDLNQNSEHILSLKFFTTLTTKIQMRLLAFAFTV